MIFAKVLDKMGRMVYNRKQKETCKMFLTVAGR